MVRAFLGFEIVLSNCKKVGVNQGVTLNGICLEAESISDLSDCAGGSGDWEGKSNDCTGRGIWAWEERLSTRPGPRLGKNLLLCSVKNVMVWLTAVLRSRLGFGVFCSFVSCTVKRNVDCGIRKLPVWGFASYFGIMAAAPCHRADSQSGLFLFHQGDLHSKFCIFCDFGKQGFLLIDKSGLTHSLTPARESSRIRQSGQKVLWFEHAFRGFSTTFLVTSDVVGRTGEINVEGFPKVVFQMPFLLLHSFPFCSQNPSKEYFLSVWWGVCHNKK